MQPIRNVTVHFDGNFAASPLRLHHAGQSDEARVEPALSLPNGRTLLSDLPFALIRIRYSRISNS